jgi:uncharacterized membrane protein
MTGSGLRRAALAASVAACAGPAGGGAVELVCLGTEPFWRLDLSDEAARYTPMEGDEEAYTGSLARAVNRTTAFVWRGTASPDGAGARVLVAAVERTEACSDGMSDTLYPFAAVVSLPDGTALAGCCRGNAGSPDAER